MKPIEIQSFQWVFLFYPYTNSRRFEHLEVSRSVVFPKSLKKATESVIFHLSSIICAIHLREQKHTFAYLLERNEEME